MCIGMGFGFQLPPGADVIADLESGDEITIKKGFGYPAAEEDMTDIVADVHQFSALTASGVMLRCDDGCGVEPTGRHFEEGEYKITKRAQAIMMIVEIEQDLADLKVTLEEIELAVQSAS